MYIITNYRICSSLCNILQLLATPTKSYTYPLYITRYYSNPTNIVLVCAFTTCSAFKNNVHKAESLLVGVVLADFKQQVHVLIIKMYNSMLVCQLLQYCS